MDPLMAPNALCCGTRHSRTPARRGLSDGPESCLLLGLLVGSQLDCKAADPQLESVLRFPSAR